MLIHIFHSFNFHPLHFYFAFIHFSENNATRGSLFKLDLNLRKVQIHSNPHRHPAGRGSLSLESSCNFLEMKKNNRPYSSISEEE